MGFLFPIRLKKAAFLLVFFAVTINRLDGFSWILDYLDNFIDRVKKGISFDTTVRHFVHVSKCLSILRLRPQAFTDCDDIRNQCTSTEYKSGGCICKGCFIFLTYQNRNQLRVFCNYRRRLRSTVKIITSNNVHCWVIAWLNVGKYVLWK